MSFRDVFATDDAFKAFVREMREFKAAVLAGTINRGKASFDRTTQQGKGRKFVDDREATPGNVYNDLFAFAAVDGPQVEFEGGVVLDDPTLENLNPGDYLVIYGGQLWAGEGSE